MRTKKTEIFFQKKRLRSDFASDLRKEIKTKLFPITSILE